MGQRTTPPEDVDLLVERWVSSGMGVFEVKRTPESPGALSFAAILALDKPAQIRAVRQTFTVLADVHEPRNADPDDSGMRQRKAAAVDLISALGRRKLPYTDQDLIHIVESLQRLPIVNAKYLPLKQITSIFERGLKGRSPNGVLRHLLTKLKERIVQTNFAEERAIVARIDKLLESEPPVVIDDRDVWAVFALDRLKELSIEEDRHWQLLLVHAASATGAEPTKEWMTQARQLVTDIGDHTFAREVIQWFRLVDRKGTGGRGNADFDDRELPHGQNAEILRGLVCCCAGMNDAELAAAIGDLGAACFKRIRGFGRRNVGIGNACIKALGSMPGTEPVAQLSRLRRTVAMPNVERSIDSELEHMAQLANTTRAELEDSAVPHYGMHAVGEFRRTIGPHEAIVRVTGMKSTDVTWIDSAGREKTSAPRGIKTRYPDEFDGLTTTRRSVSTSLRTQRDRLESCFLEMPRTWPFETWRKHLLDHPLTGWLVRRSIWTFEDGRGNRESGSWLNGEFVGANGNPIQVPTNDTGVRLWHPVDAGEEEADGWRAFVREHVVQQPFDQAFRSVFRAKDENPEAVDSARFAEERVRQLQFVRIAKSKGWRIQPLGPGDVDDRPVLILPYWNLRASLDVRGEYENHHDLTASRRYVDVKLGPLRFIDDNGSVKPLDDVPAVVYSEVMRQVTMFVAVSRSHDDDDEQPGPCQVYPFEPSP